MAFSLSTLLIGRPVSNRAAEGQKLGVVAGLPAMGLDGLSSASYGPEAALTMLAGTGLVGLGLIQPIMWAILALLGILGISYWQTIAAYPSNGGSYVVAKENLGVSAGLLAGAALMVDYLLNVAVGISAGVGALTSAIPVLQPFTLYLCLAILLAITIMNLRGTRESGLAWSVPTYLFIATLAWIIISGTWRDLVSGGHPHPVIGPPPIHRATEAITLWLVLRAFASGCTAMTGVEAVSNGVNAFREPAVKHAHATLAAIVVILAFLLAGIAHLAAAYGLGAMDQTKPDYQSVLSQLTHAVYGTGWFYYLTIGSVLGVLCLSANTSFVGFPRLCFLIARDGFLPRGFAVPGRRLVYFVGVIFLAVGAGALLIGFGGITDRLIPLFAIGAFLSFTMSQAGMAAHWWHAIRSGNVHGFASPAKLLINGGGAIATGVALVIIVLAKFVEGAWLTIIIIPCTMVLLRTVHRYYQGLDRQLLRGAQRVLDVRDHTPPVALVPVSRWDWLSRNALECAMRLTPDIIALHVTTMDGDETDQGAGLLSQRWRQFVETPAQHAGIKPPRLMLVQSQYRSVAAPLLKAIQETERQDPGRRILVMVPQIVEGRWWEYLLHTHREWRLRARLLHYGGRHVAVVSIPWQLHPAPLEEGIKKEEPAEQATQ
jgi:amino acid transporter